MDAVSQERMKSLCEAYNGPKCGLLLAPLALLLLYMTRTEGPEALDPGAVSYTHLTLPTNREV